MRYGFSRNQSSADAEATAPAASACAFLTVLDAVIMTVSFLICRVCLSSAGLVRLLVRLLPIIPQVNNGSVRQLAPA